MSFPRYPAYKPAGIDFVDELPTHWEAKPLWACCSCNDELLPESTPPDELIRYIEISDVTLLDGMKQGEELPFAKAPSRARRKVRKGDIIVSTVRTYLRAIAPITEDDPQLVVSTGFAVLRPRGVHAGYLRHVMSSEPIIGAIIAQSKGVSYPAINASELVRLKAGFPLVAEQRHIADFLDGETAKLDALVAEQEALLTLLEEKRGATIAHVVFRGLDETASRTNTGVSWIGDVPSHWEIVPFRQLADRGRDKFVDGDWIEAPYISDAGVRLLQTGNIGVGKFKEQGFRYVTEQTFSELRCTEVCPGDLLVCRLAGPVGRACIAPDLGVKMITAVDVAILKPAPDVDVRYFCHLLSSAQYLGFIEGECRGGTRDRISRSFLGALRVPKPPLSEQSAIAEALEVALRESDTLAAEARASIAFLRERRAALISAAVTGKIDVRAAMPSSRDAKEAA